MKLVRGSIASAVLAIALMSFAPPVASAAGPLYASTTGSGAACTAGAPCTLTMALMLVGAGGDVVALPGTYTAPPMASFAVPFGVTLEGEPGQARPILFSLMVTPVTTDFGATLRHLHVVVVSGFGVLLGENSTAEDLDVQAVSSASAGMSLSSGDVVRDSLVTAGFQNGATSGGTGVIADDGFITLLGDTILAGDGGTAVKASGVCPLPPACGPGARAAAFTLRDTIARAGATGADLATAGSNSALGVISATHSAFRPGMLSVAGGAITTSGGGNVAGDPLFADRLTRDVHELPGSPTIDAGVADPMLGPTDFGGGARALGAAPDIGADEYIPHPPSATTGSADGVGTAGATLHGTADLHGLPGTATFRWGPAGSYGHETSAVALAAHDGPVAVAAPLTALAPGTTYHFQLTVHSSDGTATGSDAAFATTRARAGAPPKGTPRPKPSLTRLKLAPAVFGKGRRSRVSYRVSVAGTTTFRVERRARGVRLRGRCRAVPRKPPKGKLRRCTRSVLARGSLRHRDRPGADAWTFHGRIGGRTLAVASYRLVATPKSTAGRSGTAKHVAFRIKR